ncbi:MAG: polysaccharide biosynthesis C-terminal domain-containing protein, partial [Candidatus Nitrosotenuis sp.]
GIVTANRVLLPYLSRMFNSSISEYGRIIKRVWRILVLVSLPVGMIIFINAEQIVNLLYGPIYQESIPVLQILSVALVIAIFRSVLEISFIAANKQTSYFYCMSGAAIIYTITTYFGVQISGIEGAAWAALVSEFCYATLLLVYTSEVGKFAVTSTVLRSLFAACGSMLVLTAFHISSIVLNAISSIALYCLLLLLLREISIQEIRSQIGKVLSPNL